MPAGAACPVWQSLPQRPLVMAVLNVTPDSFSDGGAYPDVTSAIEAARLMVAQGADILDIGGESTRPGIEATSPAVEQARVLPVVAALREAGVPISVDTRNAATMAAALEAGVAIINDVSALGHDPASSRVLAGQTCGVVLMHMRGTPATMTRHAVYADVAGEVAAELAAAMARAVAAGIDPARIALDPGIGFAKTGEHNVALLRGLASVAALGRPLVVGVSRKRFIGTLSGEEVPGRRLGGSVAAALFALRQGARVLRVHDVAETVQAVRVWQALTG